MSASARSRRSREFSVARSSDHHRGDRTGRPTCLTRLDEISRVIGNIEAEVRGLSASLAEVRQTSAEQHRENTRKLESIGARVEKIEYDMRPLTKTVASMGPIVAGYAVTRWKIAGAFALGRR